MMVVSVASTVIFIYRFPVIRVTASSVMLRKLYDIEKSQKKKQNTLLIYHFFLINIITDMMRFLYVSLFVFVYGTANGLQ